MKEVLKYFPDLTEDQLEKFTKLKDLYKDVTYHSFTPDLDNLVKMIADVIQPQIICDDSQICILQAEKKYGQPSRTEVIIQEIP